MGLARIAFLVVAKPTLYLANAAYLGLWANRGVKGKAITASALLLGAGLAINAHDQNNGVPESAPLIGDSEFIDNLGAPETQRYTIEVPEQPRSGDFNTAPSALIAQTYVDQFYNPATTRFLANAPADQRAALQAEIDRDRATLLDAIEKYENINVTTEMVAERQTRQVEEMRARFPNRSDNDLRPFLTPASTIANQIRAEVFLQQNSQYAATPEQLASVAERLGRAPESLRGVTVIDYLTDAVDARARGLRSYFIDRSHIIERSKDNFVTPTQHGSLQSEQNTVQTAYRLQAQTRALG